MYMYMILGLSSIYARTFTLGGGDTPPSGTVPTFHILGF